MPDPDGSDDPDRHTFLLPATVYVPPPPSPPPPPPPPPPSSDGALRDDSRDQDHPSTATVSPGLDRSFPARASGMSVSPTPPSSAPSSRSPSPSPSGNYPAYLPPSKDSKPSSFAAESGRKSPRSQLARSAQPTVTPSTRPRQSSIKHLVDRFNQTADEVPPRQQPLPPRHPSRSISPFRTRIISESGRPPRRPDAESPIEPRTNVHPAASAARRRPLFGELPTLNTTTPATGHGRAGLSRRRGSDSSVPSPHPALLDSTDDISPISPTAWYLGHTPRETDKLSQQQRTRSRHRAQSDASWNVARPDTIPHAHMAVTSPPEPPSPSSSLDPGHSRSRIPIPTRRTSHASDSERSSRSSSVVGRSSTHSLTSVPLAPKGTSRLPKPAAKPALPVDVPKHTTGARPVPSPSRRGISRDNPRAASDTSSLKVYVSAPPPKKSPPLRSSRPRQSVSTATTSASRAKVVDRVSRFQSSDSQTNQDSRTPRSRSRQLPELGNVDFAARRQKIQQAFSKSVQETARREQEEAERRRRARERRHEEVRSMLIREGQLRRMRSREAAATPERAAVPQTEGPPVAEPHAHLGELSTSMIVEQKPTALAPSTVEDKGTNSAVDKEQIADSAARAASPQPPQCDSPTLGAPPSSEPAGPSAPMDDRASDGAPPSAMTAETNDTDTTHFDSEPQVSLDHADGGHRDLLSRIMQLRESSSSSECEEDRSDQDDKESIQIMLEPSDSTVFFDAVNSGESGAGHPGDAVHDPRDAPTEGSDAARDDKLKRWSMASWSSSLRDHPSESQADQTEFTAQKADADATEPDGPSPTWAESAEAAEYQRSLGGLLHDEPYLRPFHTRQHSDPDTLVRQGGWDTKRVTKLFLEELTEGILKSPDRPWEVVQAGEEVDSSSRGNNGLTEDPILVPPEDDALHRPSLSVRDDWESVSPSIADWMQVAAADAAATPPQEEQPVAGPQESGETSDSPGFLPPVTSSGESWDGLGLAIHVQSPEEPPPPTEPPMPTYSPPPVPPADTTEVPAPAQSVSPSIYHSQPPSSICPSAPFAEPPAPVRDSEESSMVQSTFASSPRTVASSATSQHQVPPPPAHPPPPPVPQDQVSVQRPSSPTPEQRRLNKRRNVIKELVDTEYTYGRDMKVVDDIYKGTSSSCLDLSPEDVRVLFGNSDQIVHFSMTFLDGLKQAARSVYVMPKSKRWGSKRRTGNGGGDSQHSDSRPSGAGVDIIDENQDRQTFVGRVFLENLPQMEKVYTEYLKNHDAANRKLQSLQRNQKVAIWLRECREWASDLTAAWDLDSLLVKPVQRILKYPLLLNELIDATPADHPDRESLVAAVNGVTQISVRINELKKRADLVGQVVSSRKRKDSDVRSGLSKAFGRRTEKLKQQVGLSEMVQDKQYDALAQQFNDSYFQLQVVMRDVEMYTREVQTGLNKLLDIALAVDRFLDVAPAHGKYIEYESKWRRLRVIVRDIVNIALPDHVNIVRQRVIEPMVTLLKLYEGPQKVMHKRNKRLIDYARFKAIKDRRDRPDKKTAEQAEQFTVLNDALKDELPKLFALTAKMMEACLERFIAIQRGWFQLLQQKLGQLLDRFPGDVDSIVREFTGDFGIHEAQVLTLSICNGAMLADTANMVNFANFDAGSGSPGRSPSIATSGQRTASGAVDASPKRSFDFSSTRSIVDSLPGRRGTDASVSRASETTNTPSASARPSISSTRQAEAPPSVPRLDLDIPIMQEPLLQDTGLYESTNGDANGSPNGRYSGFFSSAMPMSDSPAQETSQPGPTTDPKVLFLAASLYDFKIDETRYEAGYPYLTYDEGEIFDVIAEKGELWLARNQDDPTHRVGWIWTQHFAKVPS